MLRVEEGPVSSLGSALLHPSRERAHSSPATSEVFLKPGPSRCGTQRGVPTATRDLAFVAQGGQGFAKAMAVRRGSGLSPGSHAVCHLPGAPWAPPGWQPPPRTHSFLSAETHSEGSAGGWGPGPPHANTGTQLLGHPPHLPPVSTSPQLCPLRFPELLGPACQPAPRRCPLSMGDTDREAQEEPLVPGLSPAAWWNCPAFSSLQQPAAHTGLSPATSTPTFCQGELRNLQLHRTEAKAMAKARWPHNLSGTC